MCAVKIGHRLEGATDRKIVELIYRRNLASEFPVTFPYIVAINRAHVTMLAETAVISTDTAALLLGEIDAMEAAGPASMSPDPYLEESYFNHEAWIIDRLGPDVGGRLHIARSRNDLGATVDRMRARRSLADILALMNDLRETLAARAQAYVEVVMPGYTHMQPAQPITFGYYLAAIASALERDYARTHAALERLNSCPLGAAALGGTRYPIKPERTAQLLGFEAPMTNGLDSVASRDAVLEASASASLAAITCSRLAQDFYFMTTQEFSSLSFPDGVAGTSSIMPQKKNPVLLEHIKGLCGQIVGSHASSLAAMAGANFTVAIDTSRETIRSAWASLDLIQDCLALTELAVANARPNTEVMLLRVKENFSTATDLADALVSEEGLSFRQAHHIVGRAVRDCLQNGSTVEDLDGELIQRASEAILGHKVSLSEATIAACLDPEAVVDSRVSIGGASPVRVHQQIRAMRERLEADRAVLDAFEARQKNGHDELMDAVNRILVHGKPAN